MSTLTADVQSEANAAVLSAGRTPLLPVADAARSGDLTRYVGRPVRGRGVPVLEVPADEGFWVGTAPDDRLWVQLSGSAESPFEVKAGDLVDLSGVMVRHGAGFARRVGVSTAEGAQQLTAQHAHVEVAKSALRRRQGPVSQRRR